MLMCRSSPRAAKICSLSSAYRGLALNASAVRCASVTVGRIPMSTMCASRVRAFSSAWLRLSRTASSSSPKTLSPSRRGATLISMLNCASSVWKSASAIASSTSALASAGSPSSSVRLSSISRPNEPGSSSKRASVSIRAKTSRQARTFAR